MTSELELEKRDQHLQSAPAVVGGGIRKATGSLEAAEVLDGDLLRSTIYSIVWIVEAELGEETPE